MIKQIRGSHGLTQEQLARRLDVTFATVNGWERGKHRPSPVMAKPHNNIVEVQIRLIDLGYHIGHADGILGKRTVDAIRAGL